MTALQQSTQQWKPLIDAAAEGKVIQKNTIDGDWMDLPEGCTIAALLSNSLRQFRIKPEPRDFWILRKPGDMRAHICPVAVTSQDREVIHVREVLE